MYDQQSLTLNAKLKYIPYCIVFAFFFISIRLFYLQIEQNEELFDQSQRNFTRIEKIHSPRGNILDCSGALLATNRPVTDIYWHGTGNQSLSSEQFDILEKVGSIIYKSIASDTMLIEALKFCEKKHQKVMLANDLSFEQLSQIQEQFPGNANIRIVTTFKRFYPFHTFACHLLGYLGNIAHEPEGKMGLEKMFEDMLKGEQGTTVKTINSVGKNLAEIEVKKAMAGSTIKITIDIDIQDLTEQIFPENQSGTFIIMDPADGSLIALVSRPNFDPNIFLQTIDTAQWQTLQNKQPFLNRALHTSYPPGSIFKLVTSSAALEQGIIHPESSIFCPGYMVFAERHYWCARRHGHGLLTASQALALSCNIMFYDIAKKISIDTLAEYAYKFGLGQKTGICFPEKTGLVPTSDWKKQVKGERWWPGETLSAAIGQTFLLITPMQAARMISSIFTGYLVAPRILQEESIKKEPLDIRKSTLDFLRESMKSVVTQGTGIKVSRIKDIEIYAKTSTAQVCDLEKSQSNMAYLEHAWFVGYLKYKTHKPLTIVILAENVGSSRVATDIAKNFLVEYKKLMDTRQA